MNFTHSPLTSPLIIHSSTTTTTTTHHHNCVDFCFVVSTVFLILNKIAKMLKKTNKTRFPLHKTTFYYYTLAKQQQQQQQQQKH